MRLASLSLNRIDAVYNYTATGAKLTSNGGSHTGIIKMQRQPGSLDIKTENTKMQQDGAGPEQTRAVYQNGFSGSLPHYTAQLGEKQMQEFTEKLARLADRLGAIHTGSTPAKIVAQDMLESEAMPMAGHTFIPTYRPRVYFTEPQQSISYNPAKINSSYTAPTKGFNYTPPSYSGYLAVRPDVEITYNPPSRA